MPTASVLTAALEAALVRELAAVWRQVNASHFKEALAPPTLELVLLRSRLGRWVPDTRTIEISRPARARAAVGRGRRGDEARDGPPVRPRGARRDRRARAWPGVPRRLPEAGHRRQRRRACPPPPPRRATSGACIERIARLLALAESPNRHEAEAAMAAAQRLMLKYNLEVAARRGDARLRLSAPRRRHRPRDRGRAHPGDGPRQALLRRGDLGPRLSTARGQARQRPRGVRQRRRTWRWPSTSTRSSPRPRAACGDEHKARLGTSSNKDRRVFLAGVMSGFAEKLGRQATTHREEGLVWVKDADLAHYLRRRHPYIRHVRHAGQRKNEAFAHGKEAGRRIVLHKGVAEGAVSRGRLLGPGR